MLKLFSIYFPSMFLPRIASFCLVIIATHLLSAQEFGYFILVTIIAEASDLVLGNWVRIAFVRFGARKEGVSRAFALKMITISAFCAVLSVPAGFVVVSILAPERFLPVGLSIAIYVIASTTVKTGIALNQSVENHYTASLIESGRTIVNFCACCLVMIYYGDIITIFIASSFINMIAGCVSIFLGMRFSKSNIENTVSNRSIFLFAVPLITLAFLLQGISTLDKALIKYFYDSAALGLYSAAYVMGRNGFDIISSAFNAGSFTKLSILFNEGQRDEASQLLSQQMAFILSISLPALGILMAARQTISYVFFPDAYLESFILVTPIVAIGAISMNIKNFVYDNIFHMYGRNFRQIPSIVIGTFVSLVVGFFFIPHQPLLGASLMFALGSISALLASVFLTSSLIRVPLPWPSIAIASICGLFSWGLGIALNKSFAYQPSLLLLIMLVFAGAVGVIISLVGVWVMTSDKKGKIAFCYITPFTVELGGYTVYAESMLSAVLKNSDKKDIIFITNAMPSAIPEIYESNVEVINIKKRNKYFPYKIYTLVYFQVASFVARMRGCSSFISVTPEGAPFPVVPQTVIIHDFYDIDRDFRPLRTVAYTHVLWRWLALVSRNIVCVSWATQREAARMFPYALKKIHVIHEASKFSPLDVDQPYSDPKPEFLLVSSTRKTKNTECLLAALQEADRQGAPIHVNWIGNDVEGNVAAWSAKNGMPSGFHSIGTTSVVELQAFYKQGLALIVSSWKEGFCLPVLEAQACGMPVIASDIPVLREVAGKGALFFDPHKPLDLLNAMQRLLQDPALRKSLSAAAIENARLFSWDKAGRELLDLVAEEKKS